ncbi:hypothetical protein SLA2020_100120 [Shorea laevis]
MSSDFPSRALWFKTKMQMQNPSRTQQGREGKRGQNPDADAEPKQNLDQSEEEKEEEGEERERKSKNQDWVKRKVVLGEKE